MQVHPVTGNHVMEFCDGQPRKAADRRRRGGNPQVERMHTAVQEIIDGALHHEGLVFRKA